MRPFSIAFAFAFIACDCVYSSATALSLFLCDCVDSSALRLRLSLCDSVYSFAICVNYIAFILCDILALIIFSVRCVRNNLAFLFFLYLEQLALSVLFSVFLTHYFSVFLAART